MNIPLQNDPMVKLVKNKLHIQEGSKFFMEKKDLKEIADEIKKIESGIDDIVKFSRYTGSFISELLQHLDHADEDRTKKLIEKMVNDKQKELKANGNKMQSAADAIDKVFGSGTANLASGMYETLENIKRGL